MILCNDCGEQNGDGTVFCARCGVFLEWEGERVTQPAGAALTAAGEPPAPGMVIHPGPDAPRDIRPDTQPTGSAPPLADPQVDQARQDAGSPFPTRPPVAGGEVGGSTGEGAVTGPSGWLLGRSTAREKAASRQPDPASRQPDPDSRQPTSRQPQTVERRVPRRTRSPVVVPTGSRICGGCGMPNESTRRFCAKCGFSLVDAKIVRKAPWWRRLLGRERVYAAGTRIRPSNGGRRFRGATRVGVILALIAGGGILAGPRRDLVMDGVHKVQNLIGDPIQVRPENPRASGVAGKQTAQLAFDGAKNTYWGAPRVGRAAKPVPFLTATFGKPIKLVRFGLWPGVSDQTPRFVAGPRPAEIEVTLTTGGAPIVRRFPVRDTPGFQEFQLEADDVRAVQLAVVKTTRPSRSTLTAIAEVEFFADR